MKIEIVNGEVMDEPQLPILQRPRITRYAGKIVDPLWCGICNCVTWQESQSGVYVCDHKPTSKAPYERKKQNANSL